MLKHHLKISEYSLITWPLWCKTYSFHFSFQLESRWYAIIYIYIYIYIWSSKPLFSSIPSHPTRSSPLGPEVRAVPRNCNCCRLPTDSGKTLIMLLLRSNHLANCPERTLRIWKIRIKPSCGNPRNKTNSCRERQHGHCRHRKQRGWSIGQGEFLLSSTVKFRPAGRRLFISSYSMRKYDRTSERR